MPSFETIVSELFLGSQSLGYPGKVQKDYLGHFYWCLHDLGNVGQALDHSIGDHNNVELGKALYQPTLATDKIANDFWATVEVVEVKLWVEVSDKSASDFWATVEGVVVKLWVDLTGTHMSEHEGIGYHNTQDQMREDSHFYWEEHIENAPQEKHIFASDHIPFCVYPCLKYI